MDKFWADPKFTSDDLNGFFYPGDTRFEPFNCDSTGLVYQQEKDDKNDPFSGIHIKELATEQNWTDFLATVPKVKSNGRAASIVVLARHPWNRHHPKKPKDRQVLTYLPLPKSNFQDLTKFFHLHRATWIFLNRSHVPVIHVFKTYYKIGTEQNEAVVYNLRTVGHLENDTALSITYFEADHKLYATFFGLSDEKKEDLIKDLEYAQEAMFHPQTLIIKFLELEKYERFKYVDEANMKMVSLALNFQPESSANLPHWIDPKDSQNLLRISNSVGILKNGLQGWYEEIKTLREVAKDQDMEIAKGGPKGTEKVWMINFGKYLKQLENEYQTKIRRCDDVLKTADLAFQMEQSVFSRQENGKMKSLALLTMFFLPATFVSTFMSMQVFNWQPDKQKGETILAPLWWVYWPIAGGLTVMVLAIYFLWTPIARRLFPGQRRFKDTVYTV